VKDFFLSEIISCTRAKAAGCERDFAVKGVSTDTRSLKKGDIYVALKGEVYDGHDFISVARDKGACAVVCSEDVKTDLPVLKVGDTLTALQDLAAYYRTKFDIPVVAITGSNGKTTVKNMTATVLASKFKVFFSDKNFNNEIGLPKSVLELDDSYDVAVFEMGMNHTGEIETLSKIARPDIAIITNIGKAHIGNLGSRENILKAKLEILCGLKDNGLIILNVDDELLKGVRSDFHETAFVGARGDISAENIRSDGVSACFDVNYGGELYPCVLPVPGKHDITNALFAILCSIRLGVDVRDAVDELERYTVSSMRTEVSFIKGITVIKDYYNSSPESARAALETLANYRSEGKRIAVLGEMNELGEFSGQEHFDLAETCLRRQVDCVFFIGAHYKDFERGAGKRGECFGESEREGFSEALKKYVVGGSLNEGDVVLIKGSRGMKMEEFYETLKRCINASRSDHAVLPSNHAKLYVDIGAVKFNYSQIKKAVGSQVEIMPMVKANAYGCGADIIANVFRGGKYLAVADVKEAALVRRVLPDADFVIIYQPFIEDIEEIVSRGYIPAVCDTGFAERLNEEAVLRGKTVRIHIETDTGMHRLGVPAADGSAFAEKIVKLKNIVVEGIFTHYACAESFDESDLEFTRRQTELFIKTADDIESVTGKVRYKHACAGAAVFNREAAHFNMVRPGYMLYGYYPGKALRDIVDLKPALKFVSRIVQISELDEGVSVGYNRRYVTSRKTKCAAVAVGYSDGIFRRLFDPRNECNGFFVVNGQRAPIIGSVSMDLTVIDVTDVKGEIKTGDEIAVFDNVNVTVEEIAEICGTIGYEVIAKIEDKADRTECF
jgi:alanine racemase